MKYDGVNLYEVYLDNSILGSMTPSPDERGYHSKAVSLYGRLYSFSMKPDKETPFSYKFELKLIADDVVNEAKIVPESEFSQLEKSIIEALKKNSKIVSLDLNVRFSNEVIQKREPSFLRRTSEDSFLERTRKRK